MKKEFKNMKIRNITFVLLGLAILFAGCQGGPFCMSPKGAEVTVTLPMEAFDGVELAISGNVTLHQDSAFQVKVTGHQNIIDNLERNIVDGTWVIEFDECVRKTGKLEIEIWMPTLRNVKISGSGNIKGVDAFAGVSTLDVTISGSGNIDLDGSANVVRAKISGSGSIDLSTTADQVETTITGSGNIDMRGTCRNEDLEITGSGSLRAYDLLAETASVRISGSGNCELQVSNHLNVVITGSGDVYYKGLATVDSQVTGSGTVKHVN